MDSYEVIRQYCGAVNVDILSGWEMGRGPKRRGADGRLYDHTAPEHLAGSRRYDDWNIGYRMGKIYTTSLLGRRMCFSGNAPGNTVFVWRKGWSAPIGRVLAQMARKGCGGLVIVSYYGAFCKTFPPNSD